MRKEEELPHVRIGIRTVRPFGFNNYRNMIVRSVENQIEATVEVVPYPGQCDVAVVEQGTVYDVSPDAYAIRITHQEAKDAYQLSMRVRRELKNYLASQGGE